MLRPPAIHGLIKRRLLLNFRADPEVVQRMLPDGFVPKLFKEYAMVGICLIRLEQIRPKGAPMFLSLSSENAAHRVAVEWSRPHGLTQEGVYIPRRDTNSKLVAFAGGRVFPGEHQHARFQVEDDGVSISFSMASIDRSASVEVNGRTTGALPKSSCFDSLEGASAFFEKGCIGYSLTRDPLHLDGIELRTKRWEVAPFEVTDVHSSFFENESMFPKGTIHFDHGLIMRNIPHEWWSVPPFIRSV